MAHSIAGFCASKCRICRSISSGVSGSSTECAASSFQRSMSARISARMKPSCLALRIIDTGLVLLVIAPDGSLAMRNEKPAVLIEAKGPQAHAELARELTDRRGLLVLLSIHGLALPFADDGKAYP